MCVCSLSESEEGRSWKVFWCIVSGVLERSAYTMSINLKGQQHVGSCVLGLTCHSHSLLDLVDSADPPWSYDSVSARPRKAALHHSDQHPYSTNVDHLDLQVKLQFNIRRPLKRNLLAQLACCTKNTWYGEKHDLPLREFRLFGTVSFYKPVGFSGSVVFSH